MKKRMIIMAGAALGMALLILAGCAKEEVKSLPPLDKKTATEECAVLIIPAATKVKRIDGAKRGSWAPGFSKAATLLIPAGEHTILFDFSNSTDGWSAKNLQSLTVMSAGKMYLVSVSLDKEVSRGKVGHIINEATSFVRDQIVDTIPLVDLLPRPNPKGVAYQINEIDQVAFDQYLHQGSTSKKGTGTLVFGFLVGLLWVFILLMLHMLGYLMFMGKFMSRYRVVASLFGLGLVAAGIVLINYNSSGILSFYLVATALIGIGLSGWDSGGSSNNKGVANYNNKNFAQAVLDFDEAIKAGPYNAQYFQNRGNAYWGLQEREKAIADFINAVKLKPNSETFKKNLADAQAQIAQQP